jgi:hypothetical protein
MTKLITRKKLETHDISGGKKIDVQPIFFFQISRSYVLRDKNWQETKKLSEYFAGQIASRTLKPYAYARAEGVSVKLRVALESMSDLCQENGVPETAEYREKVLCNSARPYVDFVPVEV